MQELICITCPLGCHLAIERTSAAEISVTGNRCSRGEAYAREELLSPKRVVTTTCAIAGIRGAVPASASAAPAAESSLYLPRRIPVRTRSPFPKERVPELLALLARTELRLPLSRGDIVVADALGTGVDVIAARSMGYGSPIRTAIHQGG